MSTRTRLASAVLLLLALAAIAALAVRRHGRDALWRIVDGDCVPAARAGKPSRCAQVTLDKGADAGEVVLKDRNGPL